jgi:hypothetical protein
MSKLRMSFSRSTDREASAATATMSRTRASPFGEFGHAERPQGTPPPRTRRTPLAMPFRRALEKLLPKLRQPLTADPHYFPIPHSRVRIFDLAALLKPHIESGLTPFAHDGSGVRAPYPACWTGGLNKVRPLVEMLGNGAQLRSIAL